MNFLYAVSVLSMNDDKGRLLALELIFENGNNVLDLLVSGSSMPGRRAEAFESVFMPRWNLVKRDDGYLQECFRKSCKNGLDEIVKSMIKNQIIRDVNLGSPTPLWFAVNSGNHEIIETLAKSSSFDFQRSCREAPDSTTPLILALSKNRGDLVIESLKNIYEDQEQLYEFYLTCITFGKICYVPSMASHDVAQANEVLLAAIASGKSRALMTVLTKFQETHLYTSLEIPNKMPIFSRSMRNILSKKFQVQINTHQSQAQAFIELSNEFPVFNEELEKRQIRHFPLYLKFNDIESIMLKPFCCLRRVTGSNFISDINLQKCHDNCFQ